MSGIDALQSVQFISKSGKRFAVLSGEDWETLIEWLETLDDAQLARQAYAELKAAKGSRRRAGWKKWDAVKDEVALTLRLDRWRVVYAISEDDKLVDVLGVRKRPPYDYGDLDTLLKDYPTG